MSNKKLPNHKKTHRPTKWHADKSHGTFEFEKDGQEICCERPSQGPTIIIADNPIILGNDELYFEVTISQLEVGVLMAIGVTRIDDVSKPVEYPGTSSKSYALHSVGDLYNGEFHVIQNYSAPFIPNDVIGCGVRRNGEIFFTCNGKYLQEAFKLQSGSKELWPVIGIQPSESTIILQSNFGSRPFLLQREISPLFDDIESPSSMLLRRLSSAMQEGTSAVRASFGVEEDADLTSHLQESMRSHLDRIGNKLASMMSPPRGGKQTNSDVLEDDDAFSTPDQRQKLLRREVTDLQTRIQECLSDPNFANNATLSELTLQAKQLRQILINLASVAVDEQQNAFIMNLNREILCILEFMQTFNTTDGEELGSSTSLISEISRSSSSHSLSGSPPQNELSTDSMRTHRSNSYGVLEGAADNIRELLVSIRSGDINVQCNSVRSLTYLIGNQQRSQVIRRLCLIDAYQGGAISALVGVFFRPRTTANPKLRYLIASAIVAIAAGIWVTDDDAPSGIRLDPCEVAKWLEPDLPHIIAACGILLKQPCICCRSFDEFQVCPYKQREATAALANICLIFRVRDGWLSRHAKVKRDKMHGVWIEEISRSGVPLLATVCTSQIPPRPYSEDDAIQNEWNEKYRAWSESRELAVFTISIVTQYPQSRQVVQECKLIPVLVQFLANSNVDILQYAASAIHSLCCMVPPDFVIHQYQPPGASSPQLINLVTIGFTIAEFMSHGLVKALIAVAQNILKKKTNASRSPIRAQVIACFQALSALSQCHRELLHQDVIQLIFSFVDELLEEDSDLETHDDRTISPTALDGEPANAQNTTIRRRYSRSIGRNSASGEAPHLVQANNLNTVLAAENAGRHGECEELVELRALSETIGSLINASLRENSSQVDMMSSIKSQSTQFWTANIHWVVELCRHPDAHVRLHAIRPVLAIARADIQCSDVLEISNLPAILIGILEARDTESIVGPRSIIEEIKIDASLALGHLANSPSLALRTNLTLAGGCEYAIRTLQILYFGDAEQTLLNSRAPPVWRKSRFSIKINLSRSNSLVAHAGNTIGVREVVGNDIVVAHQATRILSGILELVAQVDLNQENGKLVVEGVLGRVEQVLGLSVMLLGSLASVIQAEACRVLILILQFRATAAFKLDVAKIALHRLVELSRGGRGGVEHPDRELQGAASQLLGMLGFPVSTTNLHLYGKDTSELFDWFTLVYSLELQKVVSIGFAAIAIGAWQLPFAYQDINRILCYEEFVRYFQYYPKQGTATHLAIRNSFTEKVEKNIATMHSLFSFSEEEVSEPFDEKPKYRKRWIRWLMGCTSGGSIAMDSETTIRHFDAIGDDAEEPKKSKSILHMDQTILQKHITPVSVFADSSFGIFAQYDISVLIDTVIRCQHPGQASLKKISTVGTRGFLRSLSASCTLDLTSTFPSVVQQRKILLPDLRTSKTMSMRSMLPKRPRTILITRETQMTFRFCRTLQQLLAVKSDDSDFGDTLNDDWSICFRNCNIGMPGSNGEKFQENLMNCLFRFPSISSLVFVNSSEKCSRSSNHVEGASPFVHLFLNMSTTITWCTFDNVLHPSEIAPIMNHVCARQGLSGLAIRNNGLKENDIMPLIHQWSAIYPRSSQTLRYLDLSGNNLKDAGCGQLLRSLVKASCSVRVINLSNNGIGGSAKETIDALATAEPDHSGVAIHLHELDLGSNKLSGNAAARICEILANQSRLRMSYLNLDFNDIQSKVFEAELIKLIVKQPSFIEISLDGIKLSEECGRDLRFAVEQSHLQYLILSSDCEIREINMGDIERLLENNRNDWVRQHVQLPSHDDQSDFAMMKSVTTTDTDSTEMLSVSTGYRQSFDFTGGPGCDEFSTPRLAVLFAVPLVMRDNQGSLHPVTKVDYEREKDILYQTFVEASRDIDLSFGFATTDRLRSEITKRCRALHYSGHGSPECLLFEDELGCAQAVTTDSLTQLVAGQQNDISNLHFVFVSACYSEYTGRAFVNAGVPHVVCVKVTDRILDQAAQVFTRAFYLSLAVGDTVQVAFDIAQRAVDASPISQHYARSNQDDDHYSMGKKFLLLPENGNHGVSIFHQRHKVSEWPLSSFVCSIDSDRNKQKQRNSLWRGANVPTTSENFIGRQQDQYQCIAAVSTRRLVALTGPCGIGKSAIASASANYLCDRQLFREGALYLRLDNVVDVRELIQILWERTVVDGGGSSPLRRRHDEQDHILEEKLHDALRNRKCLLVFDHVDKLLESNSGFEHFVGRLLDETKGVRLLLTCRRPPGRISGYGVTVQQVRSLGTHDTARLFMRLSNVGMSFSARGNQEFLELIAEHPAVSKLEGIPRNICDYAYSLEEKDFQKIIWQCKLVLANATNVTTEP